MGFLDSILGKKDQQQGDAASMDVNSGYGQYAQQLDPAMMNLLNAPQQGGSAQIAQFAIDNDDIIETIKSELQGFRIVSTYNMDTKKHETKEIQFGNRIMNDLGINETCRILRMFLSKPFLLSNFPEEDRSRIDMMMVILWKKLASKYATQCKAFELDRSRRSDLAFSIVSMVYMNIMRSYMDGERPRMYGSHKTVQSIQQYGSPQQAPAKKGIMGLLG
jgi:hypothetical protein